MSMKVIHKGGYFVSAYDKGSKDVNTLLEIFKTQAEQINTYNTDANTALDQELRDILIGYRNDEIKNICITLEMLKKELPEFNQAPNNNMLDKGNLNDNNNVYSHNYNDIGIGDLK